MARVQVRPASVSDFEVLCTIGSGSYGTVKKVKRIKDNKIFVWKELDYSAANDSDKNMLVSEVNLLRELKHENIVRYIDRIIDKKSSTLFLIMEFCEGGDLATYITKTKKEGQVIEESFVWRVCRQLAGAIKECHSRCRYGKSVLHRDLKPANIFLDSRFNVKLGDFGLARVLKHESSFAKTCVGTPLYMSPEQMLGKEYNEKSDIWALGCLLYELCCLKPPFTAGNQVELAAKVHSGSYEEIPRCYSPEVKSLVRSLLTVNKDKRPSIDILMERILSKEASSPIDDEERNPSPAPSSASPSEESEHLKREVERLRQELNRKDRELKSKSSELEAAYKEVEERNRKLNLREKRLLLGERLALEKLMRIERKNKVNVGISPEMSPRNAVPENSVPQVPEEESPWRRVSSPSVVQPHRRTTPNPEKPKKEDIENVVPRAGDIRSEHPLTSPRVVLHAPPITGRQRAVKSDDRKPLRRLDQVGHCPGHLPKTSTPVRPFPEDLLTRGC